MGGPGSGRFYRWDRRTRVEECRSIEAGRWVREGILRPGARVTGGWKWSDAQTGEERASISYLVDATDADAPWVRLLYRVGVNDGERESMNYRVELETTALPWGGVRWWFRCPLSVNGLPCGRRVSKLHLPPGGKYFGCRHCHGLTYESSQESHRYDSVFAMLGAEMGLSGRAVRDVFAGLEKGKKRGRPRRRR
jgi:hypothetical protein